MNRADRRREEREFKNNKKSEASYKLRTLFSKFNAQDYELIERIIGNRVDNRLSNILEESSYILDMVYSARLSDLGFTWEETEKFNKEVQEMFEADRKYLMKLEEELGKDSGNFMAKLSVDVENRLKELINSGIVRKEAIEAILYEFPKLTKSMATNAYSKVNAELKKEKLDEDPEVKEALEYIFEKDIEVKEAVNNLASEVKDMVIDNMRETLKKNKSEGKEMKEEVKTNVVVTGATATAANLSSQEKSKLKIKSMVVEGENGTYKVCGNCVELSNEGLLMVFENPEQLDNFYKEYKQVFSMI